ncbi:retrovirus-related pol polyprotein from transposon TNT 1-94 [Tanacetum coccineum]
MNKVTRSYAPGEYIYLLSYVDNMMIACKSKAELGLPSLLKKEFDMKELGEAKKILGFVDSNYAKDPDKEAEYMALTEAVKEAIWLRGLLEELGIELNTVAVNYDNRGAIQLSQNHVFHERAKHINVHYHFIREVLEAIKQRQLKF